MLPCRRCGGRRDICERCEYLTCSRCSPCPCVTGVGSPRAFDNMAFFDVFGCSRTELALRELRAWRPGAADRIAGRPPPFLLGE